MAQPYIGEVRMFAGSFAPAGWMFCEGQLLPISIDLEPLFQLIGTSFGGDGETNFGLPDLRGRIPIHQGGGVTFTQQGGSETVTLTATQIPAHSHTLQASSATASAASGPSSATGASSLIQIYGSATPTLTMSASAISTVGGSQPHNNLAPYLCVNFIISLYGIFPNQN